VTSAQAQRSRAATGDYSHARAQCGAALPDGLFSNQKSQFGYTLECLGIENFAIFYDHLEYFMTIWNIL
jgi:hypothetical protein